MSQYAKVDCPFCAGTGSIVLQGLNALQPSPRLESAQTCSGFIRLIQPGQTIEALLKGETAAEVSRLVKATLTSASAAARSPSAPEIQHVASINVNVPALEQSGYAEAAHALTQLTEAVASDQGIGRDERADILEQLEELTRQATLPSEETPKPAVVKEILTALATTLGAAGGLAEVWSTWGPAICQFFGF